MTTHVFPLRPRCMITVELPDDFTIDEAARMGRWLSAIAIPMTRQLGPPPERIWHENIVAHFLKLLSPTGRKLLEFYARIAPRSVSAIDLAKNEIVDGSRGVGPVSIAIQRQAIVLGLAPPLCMERQLDGMHYSVSAEYFKAFMEYCDPIRPPSANDLK